MSTVLAITKRVAPAIGIEVPTVLYGSTIREQVELAELANDTAEAIAKAHEWQALKTLHTLNGDGSTEDFALPADYDRMPKDQKLWSSRIQTPLTHVTSTDRWLELDIRSYGFVIGVWSLFGDQVHIKPAMVATETAKFYYLSARYAKDSGGTAKAAFSADDDTFRLNDRLLRLGMIWKWKENKGLPYGEDMADYEDALSEEISADKGARILRVGKARLSKGLTVAYPGEIGT